MISLIYLLNEGVFEYKHQRKRKVVGWISVAQRTAEKVEETVFKVVLVTNGLMSPGGAAIRVSHPHPTALVPYGSG